MNGIMTQGFGALGRTLTQGYGLLATTTMLALTTQTTSGDGAKASGGEG